jgi:hypothetical protein
MPYLSGSSSKTIISYSASNGFSGQNMAGGLRTYERIMFSCKMGGPIRKDVTLHSRAKSQLVSCFCISILYLKHQFQRSSCVIFLQKDPSLFFFQSTRRSSHTSASPFYKNTPPSPPTHAPFPPTPHPLSPPTPQPPSPSPSAEAPSPSADEPRASSFRLLPFERTLPLARIRFPRSVSSSLRPFLSSERTPPLSQLA